jgi:hypothetical protein
VLYAPEQILVHIITCYLIHLIVVEVYKMQNATRRVLQRQIPRCVCVVSGPPSKFYCTEPDKKPESQERYKWRK